MLSNPEVILWDPNVPHRQPMPSTVVAMQLLSLKGTPVFGDIDGHNIGRERLVSIVRKNVLGLRDQEQAVFALQIRNARDTSAMHVAQAIYEFRSAVQESGHVQEVVLLVLIPGIESGVFKCP
jgi:hypothetical protein